jgi:hypothetical protein
VKFLLIRVATLIRDCARLFVRSESTLTPAHGWLLPAPGVFENLRLARVPVPVLQGPPR